MTQQNDPHNPYTPPQSNVIDVAVNMNNADESFIPGARTVAAGEGVNWITAAWNLIKPKLGMWVLLGVILMVIMMILQFIPFVSILSILIMPIFIGGIMALCEHQRKTGQFELGLMFSGFQNNVGSLIGVGAVLFGVMVIAFIVAFIVGGSALMALAVGSQTGDPSAAIAGASTGMLLLAFLLMFIIYMIGYALTWFAPALIVIHNLPLGQAISMSLSAVKKNLVPGLIFFIVIGIILFISSLPFGLGLLITVPLFLATYYTTYRSLFIAQ